MNPRPRQTFAIGTALVLVLLADAVAAQVLEAPNTTYADANPDIGSGCIGLCAELMRGQSGIDLPRARRVELDLANFMDERRHILELEKDSGQSMKQLGWLLSSAPPLLEPLTAPMGETGAIIKGVASTGLNWSGAALADYGASMQAAADDKFGKLVLNRLSEIKHESFYLPNGMPDREKIADLTNEELAYFSSTDFVRTIGDPSQLAAFYGGITVDTTRLILNDTGKLIESVDQLKGGVNQATKAAIEARNLGRNILQRSIFMERKMQEVSINTSFAIEITTALAESNLSDGQKLALYNKGLLYYDQTTVEMMMRRVTAADIIAQTKDAAQAFEGAAKGFAALGMPELASVTTNFGNLITSAGGLSAALAIGSPLGIFQGGMGVLGAASSFFGSKESPEAKMHGEVMRELATIRKEMYEYHKAEMAAITRVLEQVRSLSQTVNLRFAEFGFDLALLQLDVREGLFDDIRACERLASEFALPEVQATIAQGPRGFGRWFEADGRSEEFDRCVAGLMTRLEVKSETDFSGILRVGASSDPDGLFADERRAAIRRLEQGLLQPMVGYTRAYAKASSGAAARDVLYTPVFSICELPDAKSTFAEGRVCPPRQPSNWSASRIEASTLNPGQGTLLSAKVILDVSDFAVTVAPWNTVLIERTTGAASRIRSQDELQDLSSATASRRTRHMVVLNNNADVLDLAIAQGQLLSGIPVVIGAAQILDSVIVPAYAAARLKDDPKTINSLLSADPQPADRVGVNCATTGRLGESSTLEERKAWNTLCMMQSNPAFAENVTRAFIALRLGRAGASWDDWRHAVQSPSSHRLQQLLGSDVILYDASAGLGRRSFGAWAIQLPRVEGLQLADRSSGSKTCWEIAPVPPTKEDESYYRGPQSSVCYVLDGPTTEDFTALNLPDAQSSLVARRLAIRSMIERFCRQVPYPKAYCPPLTFQPQSIPAAAAEVASRAPAN